MELPTDIFNLISQYDVESARGVNAWLRTCKRLYGYMRNINIKGKRFTSWTPMRAFKENYVELIMLMYEHCIPFDRICADYTAVNHNHKLLLWLRKKYDLVPTNKGLLQSAVLGDFSTVRFLVKKFKMKCVPSLLYYSIVNNDSNMTAYLLKNCKLSHYSPIMKEFKRHSSCCKTSPILYKNWKVSIQDKCLSLAKQDWTQHRSCMRFYGKNYLRPHSAINFCGKFNAPDKNLKQAYSQADRALKEHMMYHRLVSVDEINEAYDNIIHECFVDS